MRMDQFKGLVALLKVVEKGSFSKAALDLGVTSAALSQAVSELEERLGVTLLTRSTRSLRTTDIGQKFIETSAPALQEIMGAMNNVSAEASKPSGLLRICAPYMGYVHILKPLVQKYQSRYPEVEVEVYLDDDFNDIISEGFDAGIRFSETLEKDMVAVRVSPPFRWVVCGSPKYFQKYGVPKTLEDLKDHNCLRYRFADGDLYDRWEFTKNGRDISVQVSGKQIVNEYFTSIDFCLSGTALAYHSEYSLRDEVKQGKVKVVLDKFLPTTDGIFLYFPSRAQVQPKLRAFIDIIKENPWK